MLEWVTLWWLTCACGCYIMTIKHATNTAAKVASAATQASLPEPPVICTSRWGDGERQLKAHATESQQGPPPEGRRCALHTPGTTTAN